MRLETGKRGAGASGDITGQLTARLQLRASNYDIELEYVLRRWMAMQLPEHAEILLDAVPPLPGGSLGNVPWASFFTILGDGIILCDLANKVSALANLPELRVKIERNVGAKRLGRFRNVSSYISWSAKFGLPLFTMDALVEGRDPSAVQLNLHRLYLWEVKRAKKLQMQARKLSREQLSRQNSRQNSRQSSRNASTTSLNGAAPASAPQTPRAKTPISAMAPTNQFSSERDYENLLKEIDSILYVGGNNITVTPGQSRTDLTSKADNEKPIADKTPHETVQRNDIDVNQQRRTVGLSRQSSVVSAAFLDQLETADPDPSWAVPEDEEREMINWVRAKLGDRIVSPGTRPGEMDHAPSGSDVKSLGKDFRTGVMLLELLQALGNNVGPYERHPTSLYDCAENLAVAIRSLSAATFCPAFRPLDIVKGNAQATMEILKYVREKFDFSYFYDRLLEHNQVTKMLLPTTPPSKVEKSELHESPVLSASSSEEDLSTLENLEAEVQKLVDNTEREPEISQTVASPEVDVQASADEYEEDEDDYEDEDADVDHPSSVIPPRQDSLARSKSKRAPPSIITQKQLTQVKASAMEISAAHAAMRRHIAKEMVMSEQKYCNNLKLLCYEYADRIHAIPALSDKEKVALTGNVQEILIRHHALLSDLEEEVAGWNDTSAVSNIFRAHLPYLECYRTYMKTYPRIGLNVAYQSRFQPAVATVAQQFAVKAQMQGGLWLDSYLLMPIQRLPRIALMLRDMLKHTPPAWNDAGHLEQVLEALEDLLRSINAEIPTQNTASLKDMQGIIAFSETSGTDPLRVLTPESDLMAATPIEGYKIQRGLKSLASDDADFHRVVATTSGLLITTQKVEAQRKKAMARSKTAIIDGPRKLDIPWHAAWRECTLGLHGSTLLASSSVEAMGSIKAVFEDSEEAAAIFWALKNALGR